MMVQLSFSFLKKRKCFLCDSEENIEEHHIDWNHKNNSPSNRLLLCKRCQVEIHRDPRDYHNYLNLEELRKLRDKIKSRREEVRR